MLTTLGFVCLQIVWSDLNANYCQLLEHCQLYYAEVLAYGH